MWLGPIQLLVFVTNCHNLGTIHPKWFLARPLNKKSPFTTQAIVEDTRKINTLTNLLLRVYCFSPLSSDVMSW